MDESKFLQSLSGLSKNTQSIYANIFSSWQRWCETNSVPVAPITQNVFDLFVIDMQKTGRSMKYVRTFLSVLRLINKLEGCEETIQIGKSVALSPPFYLLNSAMMPTVGNYSLQDVDASRFAMLYQQAAGVQPIESFIGYEETAKHIASLVGMPVETNRAQLDIKTPYATLFIVKLNRRVDPSQKGQVTPDSSDYQYFVANFTAHRNV